MIRYIAWRRQVEAWGVFVRFANLNKIHKFHKATQRNNRATDLSNLDVVKSSFL